MTPRSFVLLMLAAAVLGGGACSSEPGWIAAKSSKSVTLDGAAKRTVVTTKVGEELTLQLPPVEQPGYSWRIVYHDPRALKQSSEIGATPEGGGSAAVRFIAQRVVSRTLLRFVAVGDASVREGEAVDVHEVVITVQP